MGANDFLPKNFRAFFETEMQRLLNPKHAKRITNPKFEVDKILEKAEAALKLDREEALINIEEGNLESSTKEKLEKLEKDTKKPKDKAAQSNKKVYSKNIDFEETDDY